MKTDLMRLDRSRWWRCDFHTHSPASHDTSVDGVTEYAWLLAFMGQGIDLVAVTDHNTGEWIDSLKVAYRSMESEAPPGFRELTLFPGVEITTSDAIHLLAIFDPSESSSFISDFLDSIGSPSEIRGDASCCAQADTLEIITTINNRGGIPIPAHVDRKRGKGLFSLDAVHLDRILKMDSIRIVESLTDGSGWPSPYRNIHKKWTIIAGSDSHTLYSEDPYSRYPGCIYTWLQMKEPSLPEVLRAFSSKKNCIRRIIPGHYYD